MASKVLAEESSGRSEELPSMEGSILILEALEGRKCHDYNLVTNILHSQGLAAVVGGVLANRGWPWEWLAVRRPAVSAMVLAWNLMEIQGAKRV